MKEHCQAHTQPGEEPDMASVDLDMANLAGTIELFTARKPQMLDHTDFLHGSSLRRRGSLVPFDPAL